MKPDAPLVSILIPAYNPRFFEAALASARGQHYPNFEIVVCDDSPGDEIARIVAREPDERTRYVRNPRNLGFFGNFTQCFELARGEYIKFLNDDDLLFPGCLARLVDGFRRYSSKITLACSRRQPVDAEGRPMRDFLQTQPLSASDSLFHGRRLGEAVLTTCLNRIGEPTTVMFRKCDVQMVDGNLFRFGGRDYHCLADLSLWLRLLAKGDMFYAAQALSAFRVHAGQEQKKPEVAFGCLSEWASILDDAQELGYLADPAVHRRARGTVLRYLNDAMVVQRDRYAPFLAQIVAIRDELARKLAADEAS